MRRSSVFFYFHLIVTIYYKQCIRSCITMRVLSVNVGLPRQVVFNGQIVTTSIFKDPVEGPIMLRKLNLDGDRQADLTVHGGLDKAVYSYPAEHYDYWRKQFPNMDLIWGMFGENFTTEGLMEDAVNIGDQFQIGSAKLVATQPRMPCYKLGVRFGRMDVIRRFMASRRPGIYFKVLQEGQVEAGDKIKIIRKDENNVTVKDIVRLYVRDDEDIETMRRATKIESLPEGWRYEFEQKIEQSERK
jgi:MOSC domain-containing protein YiiM